MNASEQSSAAQGSKGEPATPKQNDILSLPQLPFTRAVSHPGKAVEVKHFDSDSRGNTHLSETSQGSKSNAVSPSSRTASNVPESRIRPTFSRLTTFPDQRILDSPVTRDRPLNQWRIPKSAEGSRAATLFLGKDYERWQIHDRDSFGVKLAWRVRAGSSSDIPFCAAATVYSANDDGYGDDDDGDDDDGSESAVVYSNVLTTDNESEAGFSWGLSGRSSRRSSRSSRSRSGSGTWKRSGLLSSIAALHPLSTAANKSLHGLRRDSETAGVAIAPGSSPSTSSPPDSYTRPRRYSSNGPEAAFLRHETVIGLHTPRRDSSSSASSSFAGRQLPAGVERISLAPLSKIHPSDSEAIGPFPSAKSSKVDSQSLAKPADSPLLSSSLTSTESQQGQQFRSCSPKATSRKESSFDLLKRAAEAAATYHRQHLDSDAEVSDAGLQPIEISGTASLARNAESPRPNALQLARRRKPIRIDGTLYDRSGPFREGAITDGLSVRLFSAERQEEEGGGYDDYPDVSSSTPAGTPIAPPDDRISRRHTRQINVAGQDERRRVKSQDSAIVDDDDDDGRGDSADADDVEDEDNYSASYRDATQNGGSVLPKVKDEAAATTYLITTPDNRVSSAAKLRRWAMDGSGNFYAAMEIKSVEAKLRCAVDSKDADASANAAYTRSLAKILRQTYLNDILDEVQKAETLNAGRNSVSKLLVTSDNKYVRLEEDYPEETFFVIAGCEEEELYPVVALVFCQALRHIHRFHNAGWMHGDIKLENLMFDRNGELVVIDYENANPYRVPGGDGCVTLMSFDWIPPEATAGPDGRRAGPSADLWALGANLVRAFALRDGIEDTHIRQMLLEEDQNEFLRFRDSLITMDKMKMRAVAEDVNLDPILDGAFDDSEEVAVASASTPHHTNGCGATRPGFSGNCYSQDDGRHPKPTPGRLLHYFARAAPHLLRYVLASCLTASPTARGSAAEMEGLQLAAELETEKDGLTMRVAKQAVETAIQLSGSEWVRPKLDEARRSLGLGADAGEAFV